MKKIMNSLVVAVIVASSVFGDTGAESFKSYIALDKKKTTHQIKDEFGNQSVQEGCLAMDILLERHKKNSFELANFYAEVFSDQKRIIGFDDLKQHGSYRSILGLNDLISLKQQSGDLPREVSINTGAQTSKNTINVNISTVQIVNFFNKYLASDNQETSLGRLKLIYAYFFAADMIEKIPLKFECKIRTVDNIQIEPTLLLVNAINNKNAKAIKLFYALKDKSPSELSSWFMAQDDVKSFYDILNTVNKNNLEMEKVAKENAVAQAKVAKDNAQTRADFFKPLNESGHELKYYQDAIIKILKNPKVCNQPSQILLEENFNGKSSNYHMKFRCSKSNTIVFTHNEGYVGIKENAFVPFDEKALYNDFNPSKPVKIVPKVFG